MHRVALHGKRALKAGPRGSFVTAHARTTTTQRRKGAKAQSRPSQIAFPAELLAIGIARPRREGRRLRKQAPAAVCLLPGNAPGARRFCLRQLGTHPIFLDRGEARPALSESAGRCGGRMRQTRASAHSSSTSVARPHGGRDLAGATVGLISLGLSVESMTEWLCDDKEKLFVIPWCLCVLVVATRWGMDLRLSA